MKFQEIEEKIGYSFKDKGLLNLAFVHRSYYNEHRSLVSDHNERLEFLGDTVIGLIISEFLYKELPQESEGRLSHLRSQIVDMGTCAGFVDKLGLGAYILLGKGEKRSDSRGKETIWADFFEALLGAIYLDGGLEAARQFFFSHFTQDVKEILNAPTRNWKAELQDYSQKRYQKPPQYKVIKETGPDHSKIFHVSVSIEEKEVGEGTGPSKKDAEQKAAENALIKLEKENG